MKPNKKTIFENAFLFFAIIITLKFIFLRYHLLMDANPFHTIVYEMSFLLIFLAAIELFFNKSRIFLYLILNILLSALFVGMLIYYRYFGTIPSYYDLSQLNQVGSVNESMTMLLTPADFLYFIDIILFATGWVLFRKKPFWAVEMPRFVTIGAIIAGLVVSLLNFQVNKNEIIADNALFAKTAGFFTTQFVQFYQERVDDGEVFAFEGKNLNITRENIEQLKGNEFVPMAEHDYHGLAEGRNLIVIQIESLQDFVLGKSINGQEVTPNINKWMEESTYFSNLYQQIGAGNTADAEYLLNTSLYPLGNKATPEEINGDEKIPSMPRMLNEEYYYTVTMHADDIEYWNRDALYPALGFDDYIAREHYGDEDTIGFGPSDEIFYKKTLVELGGIAREYDRLYAHVLSLTSHTPFEMPEDKRGLDLPEEYRGTLTGNYLQSIHYADKTLGEFFQGLKDKGLWETSVIALYGDHSGVHGKLLQDKDHDLLKEFSGERYSLLTRFRVPFIVSVPGKSGELPAQVETLGGQIDMMPTLLNLLGIEPDTLYFGHNLLHYQSNLLGMRYYLPTGSFFHDNVFYIAKNTRYDTRVLNIEQNERIESAIENPSDFYEKEREAVLRLLKWSDAYFKTFK